VVEQPRVDRVPVRRIIVIGPTPPPTHGVTVSTLHLVDAVRRAGYLAAHLDTKDPRPVATLGRLDFQNVRLAFLHTARLAVLLARHRRAAVHLPISQGRWGFIRDSGFIWLAWLARRPVSVHLHGGFFGEFYARSARPLRALIRSTLARVGQAWVVSPANASAFDGLLPRERVRVLENTCDDQGMNGRADQSGSANDLHLLFLSNLNPEKGCLDLLDALLDMGGQADGIHVRLVGEVESMLAREVARRGRQLEPLGVRVELTGVRLGSEKESEYRWADLFVFPSRYPLEGQPLVLLEAMSAGLPIVSTDHSGIPLTVRAGKEGLIVPPGDIEAIGFAIAALRSDPGLRRRLGGQGRRRYEDRYTPELYRGAVKRLLRELPQ
jgi:glycosyltransferase involved in cell wall biosynthesis